MRGRGVALAVLLAHACGCSMLPWSRSTPPSTPTPGPAVSSELSVSALPAYRLIAGPAFADLPSRLLVIQVRLSSSGDAALTIAPDNIALVLPDSTPARVFDRPRALELLRRSMLADADLSYLRRGGDHPPGGLDASAQAHVADLIVANLFTQEAFPGGQALQGFVVVDTGVPLTSLDGATLQVVAYRLRDAAPQAATYQFTTATTAASEAP